MARNLTTGVYSPPAGTDGVTGQPISATAYNAFVSDIGNEITYSLDVRGETPMTANLNMGGNSITNAAGATFSGNVSVGGTFGITGNFNMGGSQVYGTPTLSWRNRIINGNMGVDQRNCGSSQTFTAAAALAYSVDRWYAYCTGANVTGTQTSSSGVSGSPALYAYQFTGAASVTAIGFAQRIAAANSFDLAGLTATLSANLANSVLGTVTWTAYYATTKDTFGTLASPTKTSIATGTFTVTSTLTNYQTTISMPSGATTGIEIVFSVGAQTSGTWTIGNVQLEAGSVATAFENRIGEVALCEEYFDKSYSLGVKPGATQSGGGGCCYVGSPSTATNNLGMTAHYKRRMRAVPTVTIYDNAGNSGKITYLNSSSAWTNSGAFTSISTTDTAVSIAETPNCFALNFDWAASAEL